MKNKKKWIITKEKDLEIQRFFEQNKIAHRLGVDLVTVMIAHRKTFYEAFRLIWKKTQDPAMAMALAKMDLGWIGLDRPTLYRRDGNKLEETAKPVSIVEVPLSAFKYVEVEQLNDDSFKSLGTLWERKTSVSKLFRNREPIYVPESLKDWL